VVPVGTGVVRDDKGKINCGTLCLSATDTYSSGTTVVLTAKPDALSAFAGWGGDCSGKGTCTLVMNANRNVTASFSLLGLLTSEPTAAPYSLGWTMRLEVPDAVGQAVFNGQVVQVTPGASQAAATARGGENLVEAQLVDSRDKPGTWRFEAQETDAFEPGSLRVLRGTVALVTPTAVVFRLTGQRGEEVSFTYRARR
jgi:List-Bact-rpt repeat protein